ncbi:protein meiotic P26-like [Oculina patagonica]
MVVVTTWMILRRSSNLEEFVNAFTEAILPLGNTLRAISEGSVCFTIQAENRSALQALWERYQNGTLQKNLQEFLVTEDVKQLANGEEVILTVEIDEQEYKNACLDLKVAETQVEGFQDVELGSKSKFTFVTRDLEGHKFYNADNEVTVKIQDPSGNFIKKKIEDSVDGTYTVSFTPDTVGPHSVLITVNGQPLTGSPWSVQVSPHQYKQVFTFGSRGSGPGQFDLSHGGSINGISINENTDHIAVADTHNNRVQIFSADGSYLREFGQRGIKAERVRSPRAVAFTKNGDLIVYHTGKISLFSESGQFIKHITNKHLKVVMSFSLASDDNIVACDWDDKKIKVLSPEGTKLLQCFTAPDCSESLYSAVYHQDMIFASYHGAHCLKVFNKEGVFLYDIGSEGSGDGQLSWPRGITIDKFNNLIVSDSGNNRLQVFTLDGRFVNTIKEQITELGSPHSISVSKTGQVFVTDVATNCIHVFQ